MLEDYNYYYRRAYCQLQFSLKPVSHSFHGTGHVEFVFIPCYLALQQKSSSLNFDAENKVEGIYNVFRNSLKTSIILSYLQHDVKVDIYLVTILCKMSHHLVDLKRRKRQEINQAI